VLLKATPCGLSHAHCMYAMSSMVCSCCLGGCESTAPANRRPNAPGMHPQTSYKQHVVPLHVCKAGPPAPHQKCQIIPAKHDQTHMHWLPRTACLTRRPLRWCSQSRRQCRAGCCHLGTSCLGDTPCRGPWGWHHLYVHNVNTLQQAAQALWWHRRTEGRQQRQQ
jgi:hypothetical protein